MMTPNLSSHAEADPESADYTPDETTFTSDMCVCVYVRAYVRVCVRQGHYACDLLWIVIERLKTKANLWDFRFRT